ncbi:MAG TPA: glycosyltransferase [Chitinophagaceae bacterium]|nr:glycosyltransferase [Chitinophagaceae bacterium]
MLPENAVQRVRKPAPFHSRFSILIPSWNNLPYLQLCVNSIRKNSAYPHQIIVHINEGADNTCKWVEEQPDISFTYSKINIGVCYALNEAAALAETDYIAYINDDMYLCPGWDKVLIDEIEQTGHPYFFFSATAIEPMAQSTCSIRKSYGRSLNDFDEQLLLSEYKDLPMKDWQGATWPPNVVHRQLWEKVGGYSIEFSPGMYSDPDFSMKLWKAGVRLFKGLSASRAYHFGSLSVKRIRKNTGYHAFILKWGMTSGTFSKYFLRRGELFDGPLKEADPGFFLKLKGIVKQIISVFSK